MNRVHVIRDAIGRIVSMLTMQRIKVTQRGMQAAVYYDKRTGAISHVNIPFLPDDASDEFIAAVQGFLDHEVGHVLFSDPKVLQEANKLGNRIANMANLVEDVYVETRMARQFSGSGHNLQNTSRFHLERILRPAIQKALDEGDTKTAIGNVAIAAFRSWGGQTAASDFIKSDPRIAQVASELADRVGDDLIKRVAKIQSSADALDIAKGVIAKLKEQEVPKTTPPPSPVPPPPPPPSPAPSPSPEPEPEDDDDSKSPGSEEEELGENDDDEPTAPSSEPDADAEPDAEPGTTGEPEESEPEAPQDDSSEADDAEADGSDPDDSDPEEGEPSAGIPPASADEGSDEQDSDDDASAGNPSLGQEEADDADDAPGASEPPALEEEGAPDGSSETGTKPAIDDAFDEEHNYDEEISKALTIEAGEQIKHADYIVFSTEWDTCGPSVTSNRENAAEVLADKTRHMVAGMQKQLERALKSRERRGWNPGQRKGKLNPGALFKSMTGDDRLFRKRYEVSGRQTVVSLLNDCSGSMSGERIQTAGIASYAIAEVLERLKMDFEVSGFTTRDCRELQAAIEAEQAATGQYTQYSRDEALHLPIFKGFGERFDSKTKARIAMMCDDFAYQRGPGGLLQCNIDGESLAAAAHRLMQQKAERRVLLVLSDGQPAGSPGYGLRDHLRRTVKEVEGSGVDVVGIGIQSHAVRDYYSKSVVLQDIADLPTTVMAQLTALLLAP
jgi:cobalamin biosynthesis protein CobT